MKTQMRELVEERREAAGIVTLILHKGRQIEYDAYGFADTELRTAMRPDSIMAIASMTKPITSVALLSLFDQKLWKLEDPIAKFIPEFRDLKVMSGEGKLVAANHPPTMRELLSHSAGFTYGFFGDSEVDILYREANILDPSSSLQAAMAKISRLPLKCQPGTKFEYSVASDIQGYIVEKLSGQPYVQFIRDRITGPMGMTDTEFAVFGVARERLAYPHIRSAGGDWVPALPPGGRAEVGRSVPGLASPGGALFSTAKDYSRFCQMVLNGGVLDDTRVLQPQTAALLHQNALPPHVFVDVFNTKPGVGFGLGMAVVEDPIASGQPLPRCSYYWAGVFGTYFWIDPTNEVIGIAMTQRAFSPTDRMAPDADPELIRNVAAKAVYETLRK